MVLTIISAIILGLGILLLVWILLRKLPQLRIVDPTTSKAAKAKGLKYSILRKRFERLSGERVNSVRKTLGGPLVWLQRSVRRTAAKLAAIERSYADRQKKSSGSKTNAQELRKMVAEAKLLLDKEQYDAAEKKLVEVLSLDPKNTDAYEYIGRLYIYTKNIENAKEAFKHLHKLSPQDASVLASLGEIASLENNSQEAFTYFSRAKNISPNNPKYLDFFIEAALKKGDLMEATLSLNHLREVNPENHKIEVFEERITDLQSKRHQV